MRVLASGEDWSDRRANRRRRREHIKAHVKSHKLQVRWLAREAIVVTCLKFEVNGHELTTWVGGSHGTHV